MTIKCEQIPNSTWSNYNENFDNVANGMLFLLVLSTQENWPSYLYNFVDADDDSPNHNNSEYFIVYFIVFLFVGSMFLINLFVGVLLLNYKMAEKKSKNHFISDA